MKQFDTNVAINTMDTIPKTLIYETINNKQYYYDGYKEIVKKTKKLEGIMGSSGLQALIISTILRFLYKNLSEEHYEIVTNEAGLHIDKGDNLATDIAIYETKILTSEQIDDKYLRVAPKVIIEIDTKVDTQNDAMNYFYIKTEKLLNFGVEKVIWITSKSKKVMIATNNDKEWKILNWQEKIEIIDGISLSITDLLKQRHFIID